MWRSVKQFAMRHARCKSAGPCFFSVQQQPLGLCFVFVFLCFSGEASFLVLSRFCNRLVCFISPCMVPLALALRGAGGPADRTPNEKNPEGTRGGCFHGRWLLTKNQIQRIKKALFFISIRPSSLSA
jgi:hypothetical protein